MVLDPNIDTLNRLQFIWDMIGLCVDWHRFHFIWRMMYVILKKRLPNNLNVYADIPHCGIKIAYLSMIRTGFVNVSIFTDIFIYRQVNPKKWKGNLGEKMNCVSENLLFIHTQNGLLYFIAFVISLIIIWIDHRIDFQLWCENLTWFTTEFLRASQVILHSKFIRKFTFAYNVSLTCALFDCTILCGPVNHHS